MTIRCLTSIPNPTNALNVPTVLARNPNKFPIRGYIPVKRQTNLLNVHIMLVMSQLCMWFPISETILKKTQPLFMKAAKLRISFKTVALKLEGPIFVKPAPLPFVKPVTFVKLLTFADSIVSIPSSFSCYQPASHMSHLAAPLTFSPGKFVYTPPASSHCLTYLLYNISSPLQLGLRLWSLNKHC